MQVGATSGDHGQTPSDLGKQVSEGIPTYPSGSARFVPDLYPTNINILSWRVLAIGLAPWVVVVAAIVWGMS